MSEKGERMDNETIFEEFENTIEMKYGHMAEEMLPLFDEFTIFFEKENLGVARFTKKKIDTLIDNYLDFEGLSDGECSMLFQTLLDFCDFCIGKKIDYKFFKTFLEKEKEALYGWWSEEETFFSEDDFPEINPDDILENFDHFYEILKIQVKDKKLDIPKIIKFLEITRSHIVHSYTTSQEIRKKYPDLSEEEHLQKVEEIVLKEPVNVDEFKDIEKTMFLLPKEQAKKFVNITLKMGGNTKYEPGSSKRKKAFEEITAELQDLIDDIKKAYKK